MGIDRATIALAQRLANRMRNIAARAVVQLVDDGRKLQMLQVGALADEDIEDAEHHQPYGFSSVPLSGAEAVVVFPNGDRSHPLVISVSDRRHRPTEGEPGEVTMYSHTGAKCRFMANGDIEIQPAPGGEVYIRDEGGSAERLVKKSEYDGHTHPPGAGQTAGGDPVVGNTGGAAAVTGTTRLRVQ